MPRVKVHSVPKEERYQLIGEFFDIVYSLRTKREIIDFFVGLLTTSEFLMMTRRIQVAKLIIQGMTYDEIRERLGVGYETIQKVNRWLHERDDAFMKVMEAYLRKASSVKRSRQVKKYQPESLLDRYPQHRFLKKMLGL